MYFQCNALPFGPASVPCIVTKFLAEDLQGVESCQGTDFYSLSRWPTSSPLCGLGRGSKAVSRSDYQPSSKIRIVDKPGKNHNFSHFKVTLSVQQWTRYYSRRRQVWTWCHQFRYSVGIVHKILDEGFGPDDVVHSRSHLGPASHASPTKLHALTCNSTRSSLMGETIGKMAPKGLSADLNLQVFLTP